MTETPAQYLDYLTANIPDAREKDWLRPILADQLKQRFRCSHELAVLHFENWRSTRVPATRKET